MDEDSPSSKSDSSDHEDGPSSITLLTQTIQQQHPQPKVVHNVNASNLKCNSNEDDAIGDGLKTCAIEVTTIHNNDLNHDKTIVTHLERTNSMPVERRRRKLPEIPKIKRCKLQLFFFSVLIFFSQI